MSLKNYTEYGRTKDCEVEGCEWSVGTPLRSEMYYGAYLCPKHQNDSQLGQLELPDSASEERKEKARDKILG